uniref:Bm9288, isoform a n=1 Tax=Brugia malayi TaxID=6279 RepID=A0A1I9G881_BRUMA|nr:Bm9288, isoform a [Brugia malayi]
MNLFQMSEQSSRETFRVTQEEGENTSQQQIFSQSPQQLRIHFSYDQNVPSIPELLTREYAISDSSRRIIENMSADELQEMFMPSSASAIQQPYLRMTLRHALQRIQAAQQRYLDRNQFVIQLPMQANQQSTELIQQANAQQQLPQMPSQQLQSMFHVLTPSSTSNSTNAQMFRQFPQSQANSNLTPQQSQQQQQQQQTHMQSASQPFLQQSNSQNNHLITQSSQQINQSLLQSQQISQQQNSTAIQQLLLRLSQQIPTLPSQQSLQQTQPMLVQVLQQSSATSEPFRPEQEQQRQQQQQQEHQHHQQHQQQQQQQQHSLQQIPQQTSILRPVNRIPVQQMQSTEQSLPLPQQSNQSRSSFDTGLSQETRQMMQQMQSNQSSLSSQQTILQLIQQMFPQISLQPILESRRTNFDNNLLFNQRTQQQSNEQQQIIQQSPTQPTVQRPLFAQFIPCASIGVPLGILQVSQSDMQTCQQSSRVINDTFEIPQLSLFDLSPQHFMHVIQQCPYNRSSDQQRSVITTQQSSLQPCQELSPGATVSSNQISTSSVLNDTITTSLTNANESEETFTGESYDDDGDNDDNDGDDDNEDNDGDESDNDEESDNFISGAETSTSSTTAETPIIEHMNGTTLQQRATLPEDPETSTPTRLENPRELQETEADNDSPVDMTGIMRHLGSHHTSGPNNNTSTPINNDHLSSSIFAPVHAPTTSLNNQQSESDNSEISNTTRSSTIRLLLSRFLNLNEINFTSNNSRNDDVTMQSRNDFYQMFDGDQLTLQETTERLVALMARVESLLNLINTFEMTNSSNLL